MQLLFGLLGQIFGKYFASMAMRWGLNEAIGAAFITMYALLIASFTVAANLCLGSGGTCSSVAANLSRLSNWVLFGLSLIPSETITIFGCLLSLHAAAWCAIVLARILRVKAGMDSRGVRVI